MIDNRDSLGQLPRVSSLRMTRRELLRLALATGAATVVPWRPLGARADSATPLKEFLDRDQFRLVEAIAARVIPSDTLPGAREAGAAHYIQGLLSALPAGDANCDGRGSAADLVAFITSPCAEAPLGAESTADAPLSLFNSKPIYAGGPFSGRQPFGDFEHGVITDHRPGNSFLNTQPLNRLQRLAWKVRLDGAEAVPEVIDNPLAHSLDDVNQRARYRSGLAAIDEASHARFGAAFVDLTTTQQDQILASADPDFMNLMTNHTVEGLLCAPEYGGNRNLIGWQLIGFDGDSQPLGYTLGFDEGTQQYIEREDKPNSGPDPSETCAGFSTGVVRFLSLVITAEDTQPAKRFTSPKCFDI